MNFLDRLCNICRKPILVNPLEKETHKLCVGCLDELGTIERPDEYLAQIILRRDIKEGKDE